VFIIVTVVASIAALVLFAVRIIAVRRMPKENSATHIATRTAAHGDTHNATLSATHIAAHGDTHNATLSASHGSTRAAESEQQASIHVPKIDSIAQIVQMHLVTNDEKKWASLRKRTLSLSLFTRADLFALLVRSQLSEVDLSCLLNS
jgi:hypothetical protein